MRRMTARRRRLGVGVAIAGLVALSACTDAAEGDDVASAGGEERSSSSPEADEAPVDEEDQALVFAECMRDNGVDMPDPGPGQQGLVDAFQAVTGDYDQATMQQAFSACEDLMPQFAQEETHEEGWELELAECLREQGIDVSDQPFDDIHGGAIDQDELTAAMEVCRDVLVGGGQ